ncbi:MAG TPA: hypothetical protein P5561_00410 [Candidatus Omnitrophota bacterium]|nr:hypothetical protein [Candidatus Omnitrophota bacterium]HRY84975.1 hypothetical protein [Candidatus Omnitrophota bacterium]
MAKRKKSRKSGHARAGKGSSLQEILSLSAKLADLQKDMVKATGLGEAAEERLADLEIHVNLLARLLTTLCIEKLGIRVGALKRLVRRIEKEAVRDSQIMELESLYKLSEGNAKKAPSPHVKPKGDPWDQIS